MRSKFALYDHIVVTTPIEIPPCNTIIEKGERGKIIDIDPATNDITIHLSGGYRPDLACRKNIIWLTAHDARSKIKSRPPQGLSFGRWLRYSIAMCVVASISIIGFRYYDRHYDENAISWMDMLSKSKTVKIEHDSVIPIPVFPTEFDLDAPHAYQL